MFAVIAVHRLRGRVVQSDHAARISDGLIHGDLGFIVFKRHVVGNRYRSCAVFFIDKGTELPCVFGILRGIAADIAEDLIADGIEDDTGFIAGMAHHGADVKFAPALLCPSAEDFVVFADRLIEDRAVVIVIVVLGIGPGVKRFFDHEDSPLRTFFQEVMIGGIMRTAHGVDAHLFEKIQLAVNRPG